MSPTEIAQQTLAIVREGRYVAPSGRSVHVGAEIERATTGTKLYAPGAFDALEPRLLEGARERAAAPRIEVTGETTAHAGRRLVQTEGACRVVALNFASARNPGGGFLGGAKAQEEDLARCSALYTCQLTQPDYYAANRAERSLLYTDHIIYSPDVPFFRDDALDLLEEPFVLSIITAPAPNAGAASRGDAALLRPTLVARARKVLAVAAAHEHRCLVLGAWGCGVFRNDPRDVAAVFAEWLAHEAFRGVFERVVFAVYDRSKGRENHRAFVERFGGSDSPCASPVRSSRSSG